MKLLAQCLVSAAAVASVLAAVTVANAETWPLELKRLDSPYRSGANAFYQATASQGFSVYRGPKTYENPGQTEAFRRIVHKEPKYQSASPIRGVVKLGSQEFAFALDSVSPPTDGKPDREKTAPAPASNVLDAAGYNRLYFDFNHNGDLTDDKVVEAEAECSPRAALGNGPSEQIAFHFPRVDVAIDVAGAKLDYSFFLHGYVVVSSALNYAVSAQISFSAAAYREADITLEGKKHHVVVIDANSNGRFDDETKISPDMGRGWSQPVALVHAGQGDVLLIDPNLTKPENDPRYEPYYVTVGNSRRHVSKLVEIDGRYYDVKISPTGDKLTLTASSVPLGSVTNPGDAYRAVIYGDQGILDICGKSGTPVAVPEGQWKLLSYIIQWTDQARLDGRRPGVAGLGPHNALITAMASAAYKAVQVRKGATVELPFGPPYKPVVRSDPGMERNGMQDVFLRMWLAGSAGEACTQLLVNGRPWSEATFVIADPAGKIVKQGRLENGGDASGFCTWLAPSEPAKEYHVRVKMKADPFAIDQDNDSVIRPAATGR